VQPTEIKNKIKLTTSASWLHLIVLGIQRYIFSSHESFPDEHPDVQHNDGTLSTGLDGKHDS